MLIYILLLFIIIFIFLLKKENYINYLPPVRIRNFYSRVPNTPFRGTYYSNIYPQYYKTLTKFKIPLRTNCISKLN
jgi:hypothetical protein